MTRDRDLTSMILVKNFERVRTEKNSPVLNILKSMAVDEDQNLVIIS